MVGQRGGLGSVSARLADGGSGQLLGTVISGKAQRAAGGRISAERISRPTARQGSEWRHDRIVWTDRVGHSATVIAKSASLADHRVRERRVDSAHAAPADGR